MKNILVLILILFIFCSLFYYNLKKIYRKKVLNLKFWRNKYSKYQDELIEYVKEIIPYLEKWKVRYWAHAGTLLGCVRHEGIIPWDDDIDFGYIDDGNIEDLIKDLKNNDYQINFEYIGIKINLKYGFHIVNKNDNNLFLDMFKFTKENDMLMQTIEANKKWPKENYYYDEVFPLKVCKFNNIYLPIPNKIDEICKKFYKDDYMDVFYINFPHPFNYIKNIIDGIGIHFNCNQKFYIKDLID